MPTFTDFYLQEKKEYKYMLKVAIPSFDDALVSKIENSLEKYDLIAITPHKETPIQENPLDFPNVKNMPVFILEFCIEYPLTTDAVERIVSEALNVTRSCVVVYTNSDPRHRYTEDFLRVNLRKNDDSKEYVTVIDKTYDEEEKTKQISNSRPLYGQSQIDEYIKIYKEEKNKQYSTAVVTNKLIPSQKIESPDNAHLNQGPPGKNSPLTGEFRTI